MDFAVRASISAINKFSGAVNKMGGDMGKFGNMAENAFQRAAKSGSLFKKLVGANVLGNLITGAIRRTVSEVKNFAMAGLEMASDLIEVQNVIDTTFGLTNAKKVDRWARTATDAFGLTELQAKEFSGTMGAMLKSSGLAGDQIVEMSTRLAGLAGDLASYRNLDIATAFEKIRAGISGETEPLKQLGINLNVANLQAFALTQGITKKFAAMKQGEQTMLRYLYLMHATTDAQGDFAKTLEVSYANQRKVLKTNIERVATSAMSAVLPLAMKLTTHLNTIVGRVGDWVENNKELIATKIEGFVGRVVKTLRDLRPVVETVLDVVKWFLHHKTAIVGVWVAWTAAQIALNVAMSTNPIGVVILAIEALIGLVVLAVMHWDKLMAALDNPVLRTLGLIFLPMITIPLLIIKHWQQVREVVMAVVDWVLGAVDWVVGAVDRVTAAVGRIGEFFGGIGGRGEAAPNEGARPQVNVTVPVSVDNTRAPGTSSTVRHAPPLTGLEYANP